MVGCAGHDLLERFLRGELSASVNEDLAAHVEGCTACQGLLDRLVRMASPLPLGAVTRELDDSDIEPPLEFIERLVHVLRDGSPPQTARRSRTRSDSGLAPDKSRAATDRAGTATLTPVVPGFEILSELSRGGMGVVYKARQLGLNRLVALKMILSGTRASPTARARFHAEAEAVARLDHPHIVRIHEIGECDGCSYFSMELISGPTLAKACGGRPQPAPAAAALIEKLASAIEHAHAHGILHRDLKPDNVLLHPAGPAAASAGNETHGNRPLPGSLFPSRSWNPKLIDFGLAKRLDDIRITQHGLVLGTPSYMAPEQFAGGGRLSSPAVDIYSLGAILYEMLTGRPPFDAGSVEMTLAVAVRQEPIPPRRLRLDVPRDLETICLKCLEKQPARRYVSAGDLADDLTRFLSGVPVHARPPSTLNRCWKLARRNKTAVASAAAVVSAITLGMFATSVMAVRELRARQLADRSAKAATKSADLAEAARSAAVREAYQARLAAALAAMGNRDIREAARQLELAPKPLRGWEWRHLQGRLDQSLAVVQVATVGAHATVCPRGNRIAMADGRAEFRLLDAATAECLAVIPSDRTCHQVFGFQTSAGLRFVADQSSDQFLLCVTDERGAPIGRIRPRAPYQPRKKPNPFLIAMSRDGKRVASQRQRYADAPLVEIFDVASGQRTAECGKSGARLLSLDFSPDGAHLAAVHESPHIYLFDAETGAQTAVLSGHQGIVRSVAFSPDGRCLASCGDDQTIRVWDAKSGGVVCTLRGDVGSLMSVVYSPDGRRLASGGSDGTIRLWNAAGGEALAVSHGHTGEISRVTFADDGRTIASAALDGTVRLWDATVRSDPLELKGHTNFVYPVAFSPDGRRIASGSWDETARVWDASGSPVNVLRGHAKPLGALAFARDGRLFSWSEDQTIRLWDTDTGHVIDVLNHRGMKRRNSVYSLVVSPDGQRLGAVTDDGVRFWDVATRTELRRLNLPIRGVRVVAYSPDGRWLAAGGDNPSVVIVDAASGKRLVELTGLAGRIQSIVFSPDGRQLLTAGRDPTLRLWDAATGRLVRSFAGHSLEVLAAIFHPDGTRVASAGHDRSILIWDTNTGEELVRLPGHGWYVFSLAFSPNGETLVSGSGDTTLRLWDAFPIASRLRQRSARNAADTESAAGPPQ
jgi:WD40 repeat protein/serine/threonine protein kinase